MSKASKRALVEIFLGVLALTVGMVITLYLVFGVNQQLALTDVMNLLLIIVFGALLTLGGVLRARADTHRAQESQVRE